LVGLTIAPSLPYCRFQFKHSYKFNSAYAGFTYKDLGQHIDLLGSPYSLAYNFEEANDKCLNAGGYLPIPKSGMLFFCVLE